MAEALAALVFVPLATALVVVVVPRVTAAVAPLAVLALPVVLVPVTATVAVDGPLVLALAGVGPPLGIDWRADGLALAMLWLVAVVALAVTVHALASFPPSDEAGRRFWPLWLVLVSALCAAFLSADLFTLYVTLELVTLAGVATIGLGGTAAALLAAMRYLLLGVMASLFYLLGTALVYAQTGTLDLASAAAAVPDDALGVTSTTLIVVGLLLKSAIVPLHVWLPAAHGNAPGPVSAVLSGLVVKVSLVVLVRIWFADRAGPAESAALVLGMLGAAAVLYGSVAALAQARLKMVIAYSTVAQLGYVMLLFPLASVGAFSAVSYHMLAHGVAKAAMFLSAANLLRALGSDRLTRLAGSGRTLGVDVLAFGLAGVSIMGLPPSGGFVAKWLLLRSAFEASSWWVVTVVVVGSLLAAAYVFRVVALCTSGSARAERVVVAGAGPAERYAALALALLAIVLGLAAVPVLALIEVGLPPGVAP